VANELTYLPLLMRELLKADVVHVFSASYSSFLLAPLPAMIVARAVGRPVVLNYRSGAAPDHLGRSAIARAAVARADLNVVPSSFLAEVFGSFGIETTIVPNIVDTQFGFRDRDPLRPRILSTRNFENLYNVGCTLRAFRIVQERWPSATLTLVGSGPAERGLRALAAQLGLAHVTFTGAIKPPEIGGLYAAHDLYVQTPDIDNMPASILEAFASGLPVVSTRAGGVPAILTDGEQGLLAPIGDHRAVADRILALLDDPERARTLARSGHASCQRCTWPSVRDLWLDAYGRARAMQARKQVRGTSPAERARLAR
jgi:glycosyltransferase involved in cell wall biosynthesis